jgi:hypothetical protein
MSGVETRLAASQTEQAPSLHDNQRGYISDLNTDFDHLFANP